MTTLYQLRVDGEYIMDVTMPDNTTQKERDIRRKEIANELEVPVHYLRLCQPSMKKKVVS